MKTILIPNLMWLGIAVSAYLIGRSEAAADGQANGVRSVSGLSQKNGSSRSGGRSTSPLPKDLAHTSEPFWRLDENRSVNDQRTEIGLSFREIARTLKIDIKASASDQHNSQIQLAIETTGAQITLGSTKISGRSQRKYI
ncbi:MAG: hypothetical protein ABF391_11770 [Akkermansiaceae bacterium]